MFERYAIFYTPTGPLADFGARWLGWDSASGTAVPHPDIGSIDVAAITETPRKYGLHGTLKAPFHLGRQASLTQVQNATAVFAADQPAFAIGTLELRHDGGFVALRPQTDQPPLRDFAASVVKAFDGFRAPLSDTDMARRRKARLSPRQDRQMQDWGYPYIFDDFHFHLTLSGRLSMDKAVRVIAALSSHVAPIVAAPLVIDAITLMGQDGKGLFHQIHRYALTG